MDHFIEAECSFISNAKYSTLFFHPMKYMSYYYSSDLATRQVSDIYFFIYIRSHFTSVFASIISRKNI